MDHDGKVRIAEEIAQRVAARFATRVRSTAHMAVDRSLDARGARAWRADARPGRGPGSFPLGATDAAATRRAEAHCAHDGPFPLGATDAAATRRAEAR